MGDARRSSGEGCKNDSWVVERTSVPPNWVGVLLRLCIRQAAQIPYRQKICTKSCWLTIYYYTIYYYTIKYCSVCVVVSIEL
jgi:hypothetical protein